MPLKQWLRSPVLVFVSVLVVIGATTAFLGMKNAQAQDAQPIAFNHSVHVKDLGMSCLYCHSNAQRGQSAGLPTLEKCQGCHQQIDPGDNAALQDLARYAEGDRPIRWVPVAIQPDFVYFSHRSHVNAGLNCETCHGEVGSMTVAVPQGDQNMGWCLSCHKELAPEHFTKLSDCATCHK